MNLWINCSISWWMFQLFFLGRDPKGGGPKGGRSNISLFFLPSSTLHFFLSLRVFSWNFGFVWSAGTLKCARLGSRVVVWNPGGFLRNCDFQSAFDNKKILIRTILASNQHCIYNRICQLHETENQIPTPRRAEDEKEGDLVPEQLTLILQKTALEEIRCYSQRIMKRWFGEPLNKQQHVPERWNMDISTSPMNVSWKETVPLMCKAHSEPLNSQCWRL